MNNYAVDERVFKPNDYSLDIACHYCARTEWSMVHYSKLPGAWSVVWQCDQCHARTPQASNPEDAIRFAMRDIPRAALAK